MAAFPDDRFTWITDRGTTNHLLSIEKGDDGVMAYVAVFEYEDDITPIYAYMDDLDEVTRLSRNSAQPTPSTSTLRTSWR
jgi:hypothetical protein